MIPPGEFMMGSDSGLSHEKPVHQVKLTKAFLMGSTETAQSQYEQIMKAKPWEGGPVCQIEWKSRGELGELGGCGGVL
ncbi:MAG: SUMF1/EgtB/PvdO family nonheme iron enzyme [Pirellulaceae bacterium]